MYSTQILDNGWSIEASSLSPIEELMPTNRNELETIEAVYHNMSREMNQSRTEQSSVYSPTSACSPNSDGSNGYIIGTELNAPTSGYTNSGQSDHDKLPVYSMSNEDDMQLKINRQPESQHRARYLSEGSRGAIKDRSGKSHCTIQLIGLNRPTKVELFAASDSDPNKPHPYYRLIAVTGKGSCAVTTTCKEIVSRDGLNCIEVTLHPSKMMTAVLDCVGVLKVCSHDVKAKVPKAVRSSSIKLAFRARVADQQDPNRIWVFTAVSDSISCVQHPGFPEIHRSSLTTCDPTGGVECFLIGKNFPKNPAVVFRQHNPQGHVVWTSEATVDRKYLSQCHMICSVPTYRDLNITSLVQVEVTVECENKRSPPITFTYKPTQQNGHSISEEKRHCHKDITTFHSNKTATGPFASSPITVQYDKSILQPIDSSYAIQPKQHQNQSMNSCAPNTGDGVEQTDFTCHLPLPPDLNQTVPFQPLEHQLTLQSLMPHPVDTNCFAAYEEDDNVQRNLKRSRADYDCVQVESAHFDYPNFHNATDDQPNAKRANTDFTYRSYDMPVDCQ